MGLAVGIFVITGAYALAFAVCMGNAARKLGRIFPNLNRNPALKKFLTVLLWTLCAGGVIAVLLCIWAAWSCFDAGMAIFG